MMIALLLPWFFLGTKGEEGCAHTQYLEIGKQGIIECAFNPGYHAIYWFNSTNYINEEALIEIQQSVKYGPGYISGEFDIHENGSLVIKEVRTEHEHEYTVIKIDRPKDELIPRYASVITKVSPLQTRPAISHCTDDADVCFTRIANSTSVECFVQDVRPKPELRWLVWTAHGYRNMSFESNAEQHGVTFSSHVILRHPFVYSPMLSLLTCQDRSEPSFLNQTETRILIQNTEFDSPSVAPHPKYVEQGSTIVLSCPGGGSGFLTWNRDVGHSGNQIISYAMFGEGSGDVEFISDLPDGYSLGGNGSLIIKDVKIDQEGLYSCLRGDGFSEEVKSFDVNVYVPGYPTVDGCNPQHYCVLDIRNQSSVTCKLEGVRPAVQLDWRVVDGRMSQLVTFTNEKTASHSNGNLFDVLMTSNIRVQSIDVSRLTVECRVIGPESVLFDATARFDIQLEQAPVTDEIQNTLPATPSTEFNFLWLTLLILPNLLGCCFVVLRVRRRTKPTKTKDATEENIPMMPTITRSASLTENLQLFVKQLQLKYEALYNSVRPIPYVQDKMICVERLFVDTGVKVLTSAEDEVWRMYTSRHDVMKNAVTRNSKIILEGEPGFGKSTLALQFVYDWCTHFVESPLQNAEILIFLRLRQLGGVSSIYKAIRQFILPIDSPFDEDDIKTFLNKSASIVVILDGFDEYPDKDNDFESDIKNIIKGDMLLQACVILTTRSKYMPERYAPQTKRMKLDGFNNASQKEYIQKAVVNDTKKAEKIFYRLNQNAVLGDLCQIPLFFVLFAHMSYEDKKIKEFSSVTTCFNYVIVCFHSHLRNKDGGKKNGRNHSFESNHSQLDEVAFKSLQGSSHQIILNEENLKQSIGDDFYKYYIRLGILVKEEILNEDPLAVGSSRLQRKMEVHFYHKLFHEWYAAHYLAKCVVEDEVILKGDTLNPFDLQYVYRFACGLNADAAEKIITHLQSTDDCERFAILCILEQSGKIDSITENIRAICSNDVIFGGTDSRLLQRSTLQLLEMASRNSIPISRVELYDCVQEADFTLGNLILSSGIRFPNLSSMNELVMYVKGKEVSCEKAQQVIRFATLCSGLRTLGFYRCVLPQYVGKIPECNFGVWWYPATGTRYRLGDSGKWEKRDGRRLTDMEYQTIIHQFNESLQSIREREAARTTDDQV